MLASGKNVITTTSYNHLPTFGPDANERIRRACAQAGKRFHAAGEHPGFMFERLKTSLTALSQRVDLITVQEFVDCSEVAAREMLVDLMGMGKRPDEITVDSPWFRAVSSQYEQSITAAADVLGRGSTRSGRASARKRRRVTSRWIVPHCPAGSVMGQIPVVDRLSEGAAVLVAEEYCRRPVTFPVGTSRWMISSSCGFPSTVIPGCVWISRSGMSRSARPVSRAGRLQWR